MDLWLIIHQLLFSIINETLLEKSIILFTYNSNGLPLNSLYINKIKYRETCIQSNNDGIFALELNPGIYSFETEYGEPHINKFTNYQTIMPIKHNLNDIIINNNTLVSHSYYSEKEHYLYIAYQISLVPQYNNQSITFYVKINNNTIYIQKVIQNGFSYYKKIKMYKGHHSISITTITNNNWCSCPSINTGFSYGRYFYSWIQNIENNSITINNINNYKLNIVRLIHSIII